MTGAHLTTSLALLVLLAGVLHASWNAIAKSIPDKVLASGLIGLGCTVVAAVSLPFTGVPRPAAAGYLLCSTVLHLAYTAALLQSYRLADFGHAYPLARGVSPVLVAAGAWAFAGQHLAVHEILGVAVVAAGLITLVFTGSGAARRQRTNRNATIAALLTGLAIASYTMVDGLGVRHSGNAFGYITALFLLQGPILGGVALSRRWGDPGWASAHTVATGLGAGALSVVAYGIVIWAQDHGPFALVSALRETSVISAAVIAALVFHERFGWRRIPPAIAVVTGVILINT